MIKLTQKQEAFCLAYVETGNASEAYRQSYNTKNSKPESVNRMAKDLLDNLKITSRIEELKSDAIERHKLTIDDLVAELQEARDLAKKVLQPTAMISSTMSKAKLLGLDKPGDDGDEDVKPVSVVVEVRDGRKPSDD